MPALKRRIKQPPRATVPNSLTLLNMLLGFTAIIQVMAGRWELAIWLLYISTIIDLFDGRVAKLLKATSEFGGEFDSLSDLVSFGVLPALIVYHTFFEGWGVVGILVAFCHTLFAALRLARFNLANVKSNFFQGIPSPVAATNVASFAAFVQVLGGNLAELGMVAAAVVLLNAFLMVSNIPFESNVIEKRWTPRKYHTIITFLLSLICVLLFGQPAMFAWTFYYILFGVLRWLLFRITGRDLPNAQMGVAS